MKRGAWRLSRRHLLKSAGASLALPLLDVMDPLSPAHAEAAATRRLVSIFFPHGVQPKAFWPTANGAGFQLTAMTAGLEAFRSELSFLRGFANRPGGVRPSGNEGNGIHARHTGSFLTATPLQPNQSGEGKANDAKTRNGVSMDQLIAQQIGREHCEPSLVLGVRGGEPNNEGEDDFGGVYMNNVSWAGGNKYVPKDLNPATLFARLTKCGVPSSSDSAGVAKLKQECDVMSLVHGEAKALLSKVSQEDRATLQEYFESVESLSRRCATSGQGAGVTDSPLQCKLPPQPTSAVAAYEKELRIMMDLLVFALQCRITRISTLMIAGAFEYRNFSFAGTKADDPHDMTHKSPLFDDWEKVSRWTMNQYAYLLGRMKAVKEGGASLLDNSIVYLGSEFGNGSTHDASDLVCIVAGQGAGWYKQGQYLKFDETPRANLYMDFIEAMGANAKSFGDSNGVFTKLRA